LGGPNGVQGAGNFTATPPNTPGNANGWTLQTHTAVVPEPSGALLIGVVGMLAMVRRRSRR
jgi:hypothetical protein